MSNCSGRVLAYRARGPGLIPSTEEPNYDVPIVRFLCTPVQLVTSDHHLGQKNRTFGLGAWLKLV
jgi:hypothetical protein